MLPPAACCARTSLLRLRLRAPAAPFGLSPTEQRPSLSAAPAVRASAAAAAGLCAREWLLEAAPAAVCADAAEAAPWEPPEPEDVCAARPRGVPFALPAPCGERMSFKRGNASPTAGHPSSAGCLPQWGCQFQALQRLCMRTWDTPLRPPSLSRYASSRKESCTLLRALLRALPPAAVAPLDFGAAATSASPDLTLGAPAPLLALLPDEAPPRARCAAPPARPITLYSA